MSKRSRRRAGKDLPSASHDDLGYYPPAPPPEELGAPKQDAPARTSARGWRAALGMVLVLLVLITGLIMQSGSMDSLARTLLDRFRDAEEPTPGAVPVAEEAGAAVMPLTFAEHPSHPDRLFVPYTSPPDARAGVSDETLRLIEEFQDLLAIYEQRQGVDDNFTIRVMDKRSGNTVEVYTLDAERERYEEKGEANWGAIDGLRRQHTNRLVKKWVAQGVPKADVMIRWGRANQVREARMRDLPYIEYEMGLARMLGLSQLATEIGTVETFNQDKLVSSVGAKGRYQMMPYLLRKNGINTYQLTTGSGRRVTVKEEWNPLITMRPSLILVRGYTNAVGHELPGISAYHTGPYNIYKVYQFFLREAPERITSSTTVLDAYMWAVTEGYDRVSQGTSFKTYSRGYVASGYGALRATEKLEIDPTLTVRADQVQLAAGKQVSLSSLLGALEPVADDLRWGLGDDEPNVYNRFRRLNPHFDLPRSSDSTGVPAAGDVTLKPTAGSADVRFFLPIGAVGALKAAGLDLFDPKATRRFDETTYALPSEDEITQADRDYQKLNERIMHFGFDDAAYDELLRIKAEFARLRDASPSEFRDLQYQVAKTHAEVWQSDLWRKMASTVRAAAGRFRPEGLPPESL